MRYVGQLSSGRVSRGLWKYRQSQTLRNQLAPLAPVKNDESHAAGHGRQQPKSLGSGVFMNRRAHRQHHGQRTGEEKRSHDGGVHNTFGMERSGPVWRRNAAVAVGVEKRTKSQRVRKQKEPHSDFFGIGAKQGGFVSRWHIVRQCRFSHAFGSPSV